MTESDRGEWRRDKQKWILKSGTKMQATPWLQAAKHCLAVSLIWIQTIITNIFMLKMIMEPFQRFLLRFLVKDFLLTPINLYKLRCRKTIAGVTICHLGLALNCYCHFITGELIWAGANAAFLSAGKSDGKWKAVLCCVVIRRMSGKYIFMISPTNGAKQKTSSSNWP